MKIEWRDIEGYEGLYQVNNIGQIKSLARQEHKISKYGRPYTRKVKERILKYGIDHMGYGHLRLHKTTEKGNTKVQCLYAHRLVAKAFLPIPEELRYLPDEKIQINHKNCCKTDNVVWLNDDGSINYEKTNLEWVTSKQNMNYSPTREKIIAHNKRRCKPIGQYDIQGNLVKIWPSAAEIQKEKGWATSCIRNCAFGRPSYRTAYGFKWKFIKDKENVKNS